MDRVERLIRDAKPPAELDDRAEAALARILATPIDADDLSDGVESAPAGRSRRPRRGWARLGSVAAVLVLGLALFLSPLLGGRGGATAEAATVLDAAARAVEDTPTRADQYWKVTTHGVYPQVVGDGDYDAPDAVHALQPEVRIAYVAVDGTRPGWLVQMSLPYLRQVSGPPTTLPVRTLKPESFVVEAPEPNYRLGELSLDPDELRDQLYARSAGRGSSRDDAALEAAAEMLRVGYASADLRKSLFAAMKSIPGVTVLDRDETLDGRAVVVLGRDERSTGEHRELLFAADTGEYVGERARWSGPEWHVSEATFTRELVDEIDDDPSQIYEQR